MFLIFCSLKWFPPVPVLPQLALLAEAQGQARLPGAGGGGRQEGLAWVMLYTVQGDPQNMTSRKQECDSDATSGPETCGADVPGGRPTDTDVVGSAV